MAVQGGLRLLPEGVGPRRPSSRWIPAAAIGLALVAATAALLSGASSERGAIRSLPDQERLALLSRTVDELRQLCGEGRPAGLEDHCRELASFAARFDECRGECEALVRRELTPVPTR